MTANDAWFSVLPPGMRDALANVARATVGMSQSEKEQILGWLGKLKDNASAPPAAREYAKASFLLVGASLTYATPADEEGHAGKAARAEELLRKLRNPPTG